MTVPRKTKQLGKKVERKLSGVKRKVQKKRSTLPPNLAVLPYFR